MGIMDKIEDALAEPETISYVELRSDYNKKRKGNSNLKYTFSKFLEITKLDGKLRSSSTGTRCFAVRDIEDALENYTNTLKSWQSKATGKRKKLTKAQEERARCQIKYGKVAAEALTHCSSEIKKEYGTKGNRKTKLINLHSKIVGELSGMSLPDGKSGKEMVSEMNTLKANLDAAIKAVK